MNSVPEWGHIEAVEMAKLNAICREYSRTDRASGAMLGLFASMFICMTTVGLVFEARGAAGPLMWIGGGSVLCILLCGGVMLWRQTKARRLTAEMLADMNTASHYYWSQFHPGQF